jgi:signal transduction histidine kinase
LYNLHLAARAEGKHEEALHYLERYIALKEQIINAHTLSTIKSYEAISKVETLEREASAQKEKTDIIEKKNAELDSFFYRVSHDLKGPIASLLGLHNLIKLEVKDENSRQYFDMYQLQISRINNIVMDLISLTRMNHLEENKVKINFSALLDECIQAYHYLNNFKTIQFIKEIDGEIEFYSEWAIVNTILQNLIENAIKYARTDKDPFVRICIRRIDEFVKIDVEDNGVGIHTESQSKVFNMFYRANDRIQGTGLGLYILKRAVERLNGKVDFVSDTKRGTTFTILLPFHT